MSVGAGALGATTQVSTPVRAGTDPRAVALVLAALLGLGFPLSRRRIA